MVTSVLATGPQAPEPHLLWQRVLSFLQPRTGPAQFDTYLRGTLGLVYDPGASVLRVAAANPFHVPWLEGKLSSAIHSAVAEVIGGPIRVEFVASPTPAREATAHLKRARPAPLLAPLDPAAEQPSPAPPSRPRPVLTAGSPLNVRYTFETFVVGKSNQLAHAASLAVVDEPGHHYNPLFLYGGVGLGKTHLLHAIGHATAAKGLEVVYVSSETFTNELIDAIRQHHTDEFRLKYRHARLLLVDDVQFIAGKERTEEEFFHTFNAIHESGGQIVLASDRPPRAMPTLEDRLRSRFEWGLIADIQPPDYETRIAILRSKLSGAILSAVPGDVLDFIARKVQSNIRELEGSLNRLLASARHLEQPVTVELASSALHDLVASGPNGHGTTPGAVLLAVARYFGVSADDLKGKARHKQIVVPRQIAMYLLCEDAHLSTPDAGRLLNRDHTTVLHGCRQVATELALAPHDGPTATALRGIRELLATERSEAAQKIQNK